MTRFNALWSEAHAQGRKETVQSAIDKLSHIPASASPAVRRSAGIVLLLAQKLVSKGHLKREDSGEELYKAAQDASWACFTKVTVPVTLETLFPGSNGRTHATWFTGLLHLPEGKVLRASYGPPAEYEFDRVIEIQQGRVVGEKVRRNDPPREDGLARALHQRALSLLRDALTSGDTTELSGWIDVRPVRKGACRGDQVVRAVRYVRVH